MTDKPSLADLEKALNAATEHFRSTSARAAAVRREETDATNRMNDAQKAFDARIDEMRKAAPQGSDWKSDRGLPA